MTVQFERAKAQVESLLKGGWQGKGSLGVCADSSLGDQLVILALGVEGGAEA